MVRPIYMSSLFSKRNVSELSFAIFSLCGSFQIPLITWSVVDVALEYYAVVVISVLFRSAFIAEYTENTFFVLSIDYYIYFIHL